ncbi:MAG: hypothetical protein WC649_02530 [Desulfobacteria bacterium]|jgi:hypothetical protein
MDIFFNSDYSTMWAALGTLVQGFALIMAIAALIYSMTTFKKSLQTSHYTELDSMYFDLLKTVLEKPHLNNPIATRSDDQKIEYDIYAFMVWNFLEAIYDRCKHDKHLFSTWYPVIDAENRKHREWFDHPDNKHKFKAKFRDWILNNRFEQP